MRGLIPASIAAVSAGRVEIMTENSTKKSGLLLAVLLVGPFMAQADATIANVATPSIHNDLGASGPLQQLVIGGYLIAFAVLLITGARLGQTHGYRRVYVLGATCFTVASVLCGLAPNPTALVLARVAQGVGAALMFPQTLTGIQLNLTGGARMRAIGLYTVALSSGAAVGQLVGGVLISASLAGTHWRSIFLINAPVGALVVAGALGILPRDARLAARRLAHDSTCAATARRASALPATSSSMIANRRRRRRGPSGRGRYSPSTRPDQLLPSTR